MDASGLRRLLLIGLALAAVTLSTTPADAASKFSRYDFANRCFQLVPTPDQPELFFAPTGLGTYMLYDTDGLLLGVDGPTSQPGPGTEWAAKVPSSDSLTLTSTADGRGLALAPGGSLVVAAKPTEFVPGRATGCRPYPEAVVGASGKPSKGSLFGFADLHLHITANMRAGGAVLYGEPYDRFGITEALGHDADLHGADGGDDVTGNLLRTGVPIGTHDTHGWPTFAGWPTFDTNTHQQVYYRWLERAWMAGERLVVAQTIEDQPICEIEPRRSHSCDETETIRAEIAELRALQGYVDAQSGGPGEGWFRLVRNPEQAREVIQGGKLAVVIGIESSDLFGCTETSSCTKPDVDRGIRMYKRLGVRTVFVAHWIDNAFAGAAIEGGDKGAFINVFNRFQTGHYFRTGPCPHPSQGEEVQALGPVEIAILSNFFPATAPLAQEPPPTYPPGKQCNVKGLTSLGAYLIKRLIANHMLIDVDHLSERARERVLDIAEKRDYPLVSSHTDTGGLWTPGQLRRLFKLGGIATARPAQAADLARRINELRRFGFAGVPLGTDTGGFSNLPAPRADAAQNPLAYPFKSYDGKVRFDRQVTGERSFDLNTDGVAHYGLIADLIADLQRTPHSKAAMDSLFGSARAYLRMWGLATER
jgi:microsomal dipeptidase-like Zn-dependent dipeptidase